MPLPTDLAEWATDANYPAGVQPEAGDPNKVAPSSSHKATGWRPDEKPPAEELNHWQNAVHKWIDFLDGLFDGTEFITTLTVEELSVSTTATIVGSATLTSSVGEVHVDCDLQVDGELAVDGDTTLDDVTVDTLEIVTGLSHTYSRSRAISPRPTNTVSGEGTTWTVANSRQLISVTTAQAFRVELPCEVGDRLKTILIPITKTNTNTTSYQLFTISQGGVATQTDAVVNDTSSGTHLITYTSALPKLNPGESYVMGLNSSTGTDTFHSLVVSWDRPA